MFPLSKRLVGKRPLKPLQSFIRFKSASAPAPPPPPPSNGFSLLTVGSVFAFGTLLGYSYYSWSLSKNPPESLFPPSSITKLDDLSPPKYGDTELVLEELLPILGPDRISRRRDTLDTHSDAYFSTDHPTDEQRPVAVVYPQSTEEVSLIMKSCHKHRVPVVPFTGGTSLEGHFIPTRKGICIDLTRLDKIIAVRKEDLDVTVQAAVGWQRLAEYLKDYNLMFGPDPGPGACIGGMVGTSCSGTNAARWGTMKENVISLTVVLADGTVIKTKKRPRKSAAGYNLNGLFIGSEGTLGIVTEATLKLNVIPKYENVAVVSFPTIADAGNAVATFVQEGVQLDAMELLDDTMMHYVNVINQTSLKYEEAPTLMLKFGGLSEDTVKSQIKAVQKICKEHKNTGFKFARSEKEKAELWNARKVALWSTISYGQEYIDQDIQVWATDVAVPISKLVECLTDTKEELIRVGLAGAIVGHVGDGNYHAMILFKKSDREKTAKVVQHMIDRALAVDGTVTGEHGVGWGKKPYLLEELSPDAIGLMRKIKLALDPYRILNPDKVFAIDPRDESKN
ncbi:DEKNAAC104260 [Brettanomyces naardenensis]|uniref:D-lactate dehydrogenase (cytochrome) n=1 Tax=Brettanomyces naardenensis TaxID=13370 RepID=A0A448YQ64_BRENA|nr:DEKNAAC104260 [Brettanomyces naardenensis]